jgi:hypothetical protein
VMLMALPRAVSRRNRRHSRTWAFQARSMMGLGRPSRRTWISGLTRAGWLRLHAASTSRFLA